MVLRPGNLQKKYWKNWTTRDDLTGLLRWENILSVDGDQYIDRSAFVFAYWTLGPKFPAPQEKLFVDRGVPYDPLKKVDPDVTLSAEERDIGGLGIFMTKKVMDDISYEYKNGQNILTLKQTIL